MPAEPALTPAIHAARRERRRREQHFRRRRRDLLEDFGVAIIVTIVALILTAGLGVLALIEIPVGAAVIASFLIERRRLNQRRLGAGRERSQDPPTYGRVPRTGDEFAGARRS